MKKILLPFLAFAFYKINAQTPITSSNMPSNGDTIRYTNAPLGNFDFTTKGANYTWNYSNLGITNQDIYKFQGLLQTPYAQLALSGLPFGAFGYKIADSLGGGGFSFKDIYTFFEKNSASWRGVGTALTIPLAGTPVKTGGVYSDKDEIYTFPLNYDDKDSTTFKVSTPLGISFLNVGSFTQKGYRLNKVEGWGKISTPYAGNINCLKIKSVVNEIDSLKLAIPGQQAISVGFPVSRVEYKWLSTTEKIPVLEVSGTMIGNTFTPTTIRYRDNYKTAPLNPALPKIKFTINKNTGKTLVDTFKFTNTSTPNFGNTYTWTITSSAGVQFVNGTTNASQNPSIVFSNTGVYTVKLSATNFAGTRDSTAINMITISNTNSIQKINTNGIEIYPNPVVENLVLKNELLIGKIFRIFDMSGKLILEEKLNNSLQINCKELSKGNYTLLILDNENLLVEQFIKQ